MTSKINDTIRTTIILKIMKGQLRCKDLSAEYLDDKEIVLNSIIHTIKGLAYVSDRLKDDEDVVKQSVSNDGSTFEYASERLKKNKSFILELAAVSIYFFIHVNQEITQELPFIIKALEINPHILKYVHTSLQNNKEVVLAAVKKDGAMLNFATDELKNDMDIVLEAFYRSKLAWSYMSENMLKSPEIIFVGENRELISIDDWPIIKEALFKTPNTFLNPNNTIKTLCEDMPNKYVYLAEYALSELHKKETTFSASNDSTLVSLDNLSL